MDKLIKAIETFSKEQMDQLDRPTHHFRNRYSHTLRVLEWASRISKKEGGDMDIITCAVLLHDIGWKEGRNHAEVSYELSKEFLEDWDIPKKKKNRILEAVRYHNRREDYKDLSLESHIVMDADLLDELGALSIILDAMAEGEEKPSSYRSTVKRILSYSEKLNDEKDLVVTKAGRKFYEDRLKVRNDFIEELLYEIVSKK